MNLLRIYVSVVVVLIVAYMFFFNHRKKITKMLLFQTDELLYRFDTAVVANKDIIYDYEATKHILFHNQAWFFKKWKSYTDLTVSLIKDVEYLQWLLQKDITTTSELKIIKATYITRQKINTLKEYTHTILIILTLWIGKLLLP